MINYLLNVISKEYYGWLLLMVLKVTASFSSVILLLVLIFGNIPFGRRPGQSINMDDALIIFPSVILFVLFWCMVYYCVKIVRALLIVRKNTIIEALIVEVFKPNTLWNLYQLQWGWAGAAHNCDYVVKYNAFSIMPKKGEKIKIYIDPQRPSKFIVYGF